MRPKNPSAILIPEWRISSSAETAQIIEDAEWMRADHLAKLLRSASRRMARLAHAALAALRVQRPRKRAS